MSLKPGDDLVQRSNNRKLKFERIDIYPNNRQDYYVCRIMDLDFYGAIYLRANEFDIVTKNCPEYLKIYQ